MAYMIARYHPQCLIPRECEDACHCGKEPLHRLAIRRVILHAVTLPSSELVSCFFQHAVAQILGFYHIRMLTLDYHGSVSSSDPA